MPTFLDSLVNRIKTFLHNFLKGSHLSLLSLKAYYSYKKLLLIPVLSAFTMMLIFSTILGGLLLNHNLITHSSAQYLIFALVGALIIFFILLANAFFNVCMVFATDSYLEKGSMSLSKVLRQTFGKFKVILKWASIEALIVIISGKGEEKDSTAKDLFSFAAGVSWRFISFFIYPIIAFEDLSLFSSIKHSAKFMKSNFGKVSGSIFSFKILNIFMLFALLGVTKLHQLILHLMSNPSAETVQVVDKSKNMSILLFLIPYAFMWAFALMQFIIKAQVALSTVLYRYAKGLSTGIFKEKNLKSALSEK